MDRGNDDELNTRQLESAISPSGLAYVVLLCNAADKVHHFVAEGGIESARRFVQE